MTTLHRNTNYLKWPILLTVLLVGVALYQQYGKRYIITIVPAGQLGDRPREVCNFQKTMDELNAAKVAQDDPRLIQLIRDHYIVPPSTKWYNLSEPTKTDVSREGFSASIHKKWLNKKTGGFFIEAGAFDGEFISNTLYLEREHKWRGILIEADPVPYAKLKTKNRNAFLMNACISTKPYPSVMNYSCMAVFGRVLDNDDAAAYTDHFSKRMDLKTIQVQCFPLYSILLALGQLTVDFFSLDVNGSDLDVLKTVPLQKANLSLILLEFSHVDGRLPAVISYLKPQGYRVLETHREDVLLKN